MPECTQCMNPSTMTLYNGQCYPLACNIYGCSVCANWATPVTCLQCNQGLLLSNGVCIKLNCNNNVPNCINCIENGTCLGCAQGYLLVNTTGTTSCVQAPSSCNVPNCVQCVSGNPNQCSQCAMPYNVTSNGQCACGFQNCLSCQQSGISCDACPMPLFATPHSQGCIPAPSLKHTCNVANCEQCLT